MHYQKPQSTLGLAISANTRATKADTDQGQRGQHNSAISLVCLQPNLAGLRQWALRQGHILDHDDDLGYALKQASQQVFGHLTFKPFTLRDRHGQVELLGYVPAADALVEHIMHQACQSRTVQELAQLLRFKRAQIHPMPANWQQGQRLAFVVRVRPVARGRLGRFGGVREMDIAALAARRGQRHFSRNGAAHTPARDNDRIYLDWVGERLTRRGALLRSARIIVYQQTAVLHRRFSYGRSYMSARSGPDLVVRGVLQVRNSEEFSRGLLHGIGRHTNVGFGCLLLSPADRPV
ncbi:MAG: type I-E CRISPR-associated protein Cas6/Cse3/CasE [Pseudomonadota bacterium]